MWADGGAEAVEPSWHSLHSPGQKTVRGTEREGEREREREGGREGGNGRVREQDDQVMRQGEQHATHLIDAGTLAGIHVQ